MFQREPGTSALTSAQFLPIRAVVLLIHGVGSPRMADEWVAHLPYGRLKLMAAPMYQETMEIPKTNRGSAPASFHSFVPQRLLRGVTHASSLPRQSSRQGGDLPLGFGIAGRPSLGLLSSVGQWVTVGPRAGQNRSPGRGGGFCGGRWTWSLSTLMAGAGITASGRDSADLLPEGGWGRVRAGKNNP